MVRTDIQNLTACLTPIFAKSQLWTNQKGTSSRGVPGFIPGTQVQGGGSRHVPSDHPGVTC